MVTEPMVQIKLGMGKTSIVEPASPMLLLNLSNESVKISTYNPKR